MFHRICFEQKQKMEEDLDLFFNNNASQQKKKKVRDENQTVQNDKDQVTKFYDKYIIEQSKRRKFF